MYHKFKIGREKIIQHLRKEENYLFYWVPVFYGGGIALYFSLKSEPSFKVTLGYIVFSLCVYGCARFKEVPWQRYGALGCVLVALGFGTLKLKTDLLETPIIIGNLGFQKLEGTVTALERLPSYTRVLLEDVMFSKALRQDLPIPTKIRISLRGRLQPGSHVRPGDRISVKASLRPPSRPVAPGSYDFRRRAYFQGIGAVGYGITPLVPIDKLSQRKSLYDRGRHAIMHKREQLTDYIRRTIPGQSGAVVAALVTGDRSGLYNRTRQAFADAGIAHILAISGLHLSIVAGLIFFTIRSFLSLMPPLALRYNTKKIAAAIALIFTFFYLILSGATIPAERAFIMTSLVLVAVMTDRVALTLRNVALAALIVMMVVPESLVGPSFQLSFAAVVGLVAAYEKMHPVLSRWQAQAVESHFPSLKRGLLYLSGLIFSSLIATLATAPFTIFTFNRFSFVALLTNLIAIPLVSFIIMPLIVFALLTAPFTSFITSPLLDQALGGLIALAFQAQKLPGAIVLVSSISPIVQFFCISGFLWFALMQSTWRKWGLLPMVLSLAMVPFQSPPTLYIPSEQNFMGYHDETQKKTWVNTLRSGRFARKTWLQLIGQQSATMSLKPQKCQKNQGGDETCYVIEKGGVQLFITQKMQIKWRKKVYALFVNIKKKGSQMPFLSSEDFRYKGGHFIWIDKGGVHLQSVQDRVGKRPWS